MNTTVKSLGDDASHMAQGAALGAEHAIRSTQQMAQHGVDSLDSVRAHTSAALQQLAQDTNALTHRSMDALRDGGQQLRERSLHARQATTEYIQHEPIKSVLMAAALGATLMGVFALLSRHRGNGH